MHIWDIKQKAANEQTKHTDKQTNSQIQKTEWWLPKEKEARRRMKRAKGEPNTK